MQHFETPSSINIPLSPFITTHILEPTHLSISSNQTLLLVTPLYFFFFLSLFFPMTAFGHDPARKEYVPKGRSWDAIIDGGAGDESAELDFSK